MFTSTSARRRRIALAVIAGAGTFGIAGTSAASLGGVTGATLGADSVVVGSCDTDGVSLAYTNAYDATSGTYRTTAVTVGAINAACNGKTLSLTVKGTAGAALASGTATVATGAATVTLATPVASNTVLGAAIVISG